VKEHANVYSYNLSIETVAFIDAVLAVFVLALTGGPAVTGVSAVAGARARTVSARTTFSSSTGGTG